METYLSAQSYFQKSNFGNSSLKTRKSVYQTFLVLCNFTECFYFVLKLLPKILNLFKWNFICETAQKLCLFFFDGTSLSFPLDTTKTSFSTSSDIIFFKYQNKTKSANFTIYGRVIFERPNGHRWLSEVIWF